MKLESLLILCHTKLITWPKVFSDVLQLCDPGYPGTQNACKSNTFGSFFRHTV